MAIGAITVLEKSHAGGPLRADLISFAADGSYPTGGTAAFEASVRAALDVGAVDVLGVCPQDCGGYQVVYDRANDKLKVYQGDNDNASDAPGVQVPNTTNLAAVTFVLLVLSK